MIQERKPNKIPASQSDKSSNGTAVVGLFYWLNKTISKQVKK